MHSTLTLIIGRKPSPVLQQIDNYIALWVQWEYTQHIGKCSLVQNFTEMPPDPPEAVFTVFISWNMSHSSHTPTNDCHIFSSLLTRANLAPPKSVSQNRHWWRRSEEPSCYNNDGVSVSCQRQWSEAIRFTGTFFSLVHFFLVFIFELVNQSTKIMQVCIQRRFPAISYACVCLPITVKSIYIQIYAKLNGMQSTLKLFNLMQWQL